MCLSGRFREARDVSCEANWGVPLWDGELLLYVFRDVDEDGAGAAGCCKKESLTDDSRDIVYI